MIPVAKRTALSPQGILKIKLQRESRISGSIDLPDVPAERLSVNLHKEGDRTNDFGSTAADEDGSFDASRPNRPLVDWAGEHGLLADG